MGFEPMIRLLQSLALPLGHVAIRLKNGYEFVITRGERAGDRARTDDLFLGKETFYQLNYARNSVVNLHEV